MATINMKLAAKGRGEPLRGIRDQGAYTLELIAKHPALSTKGWKPADTDALESALGELDAQRAEQVELKDVSLKSTSEESEAISEAKAFKYELLLAVDSVFADAADNGTELPVTRKAFDAGRLGTLKRVSSKIVSYLTDVWPAVVQLDGHLKPYFNNESVVTRLDLAKDTLSGKNAEQQVALSSLPGETLEVYACKGRVLSLVEKANRLGKLLYAREAVKAAPFNKDVLLQARRQRAVPAAATPS